MKGLTTSSGFAIKLIGSLFSLISVSMLVFICWMIYEYRDSVMGNEAVGFLSSACILCITTFIIAFLLWWIALNKNPGKIS